ncbi:S-adenosyl-L-methionine-dependent methyltransferase [Syncephalastrum racemosum]|uniref:S-adenosyl-L-methionine-dependent methyltransferase n=1 Tax=Syncephalastrum racemosum TaxID=13706 RepID=A0A1X2HU13_SYNRA|nr:S-adenosyl-L-methionine-dependent methyltransferase [Syncephalastrum racemosum]
MKRTRRPPSPPATNSLGAASGESSSPDSTFESIIRHGRKYQNFSDSTYWLPSDDEEMDRLVGQHFAIKALYDGNIIKEAIPLIPLHNGAQILDVGCGPGTWIMDVATEYPESEFTGIDMCPVFPTDIRPPNVNFQYGNVMERLPFDDNTFDLINMRFFILALRKEDWDVVLPELHRILKPGGVLQSLESSMLESGTDFVRHAGKMFKEIMVDRGQEPYIASKLGGILERNSFKVVEEVTRDAFLSRKDKVNREFLWDMVNIFKGAQPFLAEKLGITEADFPTFLEKFCADCKKAIPEEAVWSITIYISQKLPLS